MRTWWATASGVGLGFAALLATVPALPAASVPEKDDVVALSLDGLTWSDGLDGPLFDPDRVWVPGDAERASLLVRNDGHSRADGLLTVSPGGASLLAQALGVRVRAGSDPWHDDGRAAFAIGAGEVVPIDLEVVFTADADNRTQDSTATLDLSMTLVGDAPDASRHPGWLPQTGADLELWLALAAAGLVGGSLLRHARRKVLDHD